MRYNMNYFINLYHVTTQLFHRVPLLVTTKRSIIETLLQRLSHVIHIYQMLDMGEKMLSGTLNYNTNKHTNLVAGKSNKTFL